jgi:hypothetical protein
MVDEFRWNRGDTNYSISRKAVDTDNKTYQYGSQIVYVYVNQDVTLSRDAKNWEISDGEYTGNIKWAAVNLALKAGWNLVQIDSNTTANGNNMT